jgi:hypothetical protein
MVEPKIEKTEKVANAEKKQEPQPERTPAPTPEVNRYWSYVQNARMLEVPKVAIFSGEGGLVVVPLDRLGRVLLDSSLFLPVETLDKLAESMAKLVDEEKEKK